MRPTFLTICWAILILVWFIAAFSAKPAKQRQEPRSRLITILSLALAFALLSGRIDYSGLGTPLWSDSTPIRVLADSLVFLGLIICLWARACLGTNWSGAITLKENHELIQKGPYRFVRNPMYTGLLLMFLGTAFAAGKVSSLVAVLICFFALWRKVRLEEELLLANFPDTYPAYKSRTKALVPFVF